MVSGSFKYILLDILNFLSLSLMPYMVLGASNNFLC